MKVGTDGVLLGAWSEVENAGKILDIGTGTGLIALMAAQRNPLAEIDALEIEENACKQAEENVSASPWATRIKIIPIALQNYNPGILYDSIICNPPFFNKSTKAPDPGRTLARHNETLPPHQLLANTARLLASGGYFCVILPTAEALALIAESPRYQLYPAHITEVVPTPGKPTKRVLIKFCTTPVPVQEDKLTLELSRHQYSHEYIQLTKEFHPFL